MRVQFAVVGVQKAATTALDSVLRQHPGLCLPSRKEVHDFDDERIDWRRPDHRAYHAFFSPQTGQMCGEVTPIYSYWPPSMSRLQAYNPQLRILMCLRDPVARAWSHWTMEVARVCRGTAICPGHPRGTTKGFF